MSDSYATPEQLSGLHDRSCMALHSRAQSQVWGGLHGGAARFGGPSDETVTHGRRRCDANRDAPEINARAVACGCYEA
jgi:hypothetical protein